MSVPSVAKRPVSTDEMREKGVSSTMSDTIVRIACGLLAVILGAMVLRRRRRDAEREQQEDW